MSEVVTLSLRTPIERPIDLDGLTPDRLASMTEREIAALPLWAGRRAARVGDYFSVTGAKAARIRIDGDLSQARRVASGMSGGELMVDGHVGDDAGSAMSGGVLRITGDAGHRLGGPGPGAAKGMRGGEIVVEGSAGREAAARARRGLVVIGGDAGDEAARAIIAGTLVVLGRTGAWPGRGSKRGSIVAAGGIAVPATYRYACTFQPTYVRLLMVHLRRQYGLPIPDRVLDGRYVRYCGDAGAPGKGEIMELIAE